METVLSVAGLRSPVRLPADRRDDDFSKPLDTAELLARFSRCSVGSWAPSTDVLSPSVTSILATVYAGSSVARQRKAAAHPAKGIRLLPLPFIFRCLSAESLQTLINGALSGSRAVLVRYQNRY